MLTIFLILAGGMASGYLLRKNKRLIGACDKLAVVAIWMLLLVLGASVGSDERILSNFHQLSLRAGVICLFAVAGSIVAVQVVHLCFFRSGGSDS